MYKFKKGDRIKVVNLKNNTNFNDINVRNGMTGTVIENNSFRPWIEFDQFIGGEKSYNNSGRGYTMCMWQEEIDFLDEEEVKTKRIELNIDRQTIDWIPFDNNHISILSENTRIEGVNNNMKMLEIYKERKIKEFNDEKNNSRKEIMKEDAFKILHLQFMNQLKELYKNEYDEELKYEICLGETFLTKESKEKLEEIEDKYKDQICDLEKTLSEVNAQLELTSDYDTQIKILKNYEILDKGGKINA